MIQTDKYSERFPALRFEAPEPTILELIIEQTGKLNALTPTMHLQLSEVWDMIDKDPQVRVVVVRGAEGNFSAGGDFEIVDTNINGHDPMFGAWKEARALVYNMINCDKIIVSAIEGVAVGAGIATALLADVSVAGRNARLIDGHLKLGVAAGDHAAIIWPLLCGMAKAKYYLLLNEEISGEEAERIGLVSRVANDGEAYDEALQIARRLAISNQPALRWTKYALNNWLRSAGPTFDTSLALEMLGFRMPGAAEGFAAVKEKRSPNFDSAASDGTDSK